LAFSQARGATCDVESVFFFFFFFFFLQKKKESVFFNITQWKPYLMMIVMKILSRLSSRDPLKFSERRVRIFFIIFYYITYIFSQCFSITVLYIIYVRKYFCKTLRYIMKNIIHLLGY
jgi:hypothetical protein